MENVGELCEISGEEEFEWKSVDWKIKQFYSLPAEVRKFYTSPVFSFAGTSWFLAIQINLNVNRIAKDGKTVDSIRPIVLYVCRNSTGPPIQLEYFWGFKTLEGKVNLQQHFTDNFENNQGVVSRFITSFEDLEKSPELVPSGVLTVVCKMRYPKTADTSNHTAVQKCSHCKSTLDAQQLKCKKTQGSGDATGVKNGRSHKRQKTGAEGKSATKKCRHCKSTLDAHEDLSFHQKKCMDKPIKCPECSDVIALKDWYDHKCQKTETEEICCCQCIGQFMTFSFRKDTYYTKKRECFHPRHFPTASKKLWHDFEAIKPNGDYSDIVVNVKGERFRLHRIILAAHSQYFDSMFKTDMKKKATDILTIEDCEPDVFRSFINFVYFGKVDTLSTQNVCVLYEAAVKYKEGQLKDKCLRFMMNTLSVDSFCDYFALALRHDEKELFQRSDKFFTTEGKQIVRNEKWQTVMKEYTTQAHELFIKILDRSVE